METTQKSRITVTTVAQYAGVSRTAVYAVLNSKKKLNIGVSEKTREKVLEAIQVLGYSPNDSARGLVSGKTYNIGLLLASPDSRLSVRLTGAIGDLFSAKGFMVISGYSNNDPAVEREKLEMLLRKRVDCLIVSRLSPESNQDIIALYAQYGIPVLVMGKDVSFDERQVMEMAADSLAAKKRNRLFFVGFSDRRQFANSERQQFLAEAVKKHPPLKLTGCAAVGGSADCRKLAMRIAAQPCSERPQVLVCYNDQLADSMIGQLQLAGLKIPQEIGVIGIDGYPDDFDQMKLTGVRLPVNKMARALWRKFSAPEKSAEEIIAPEWVNGETM